MYKTSRSECNFFCNCKMHCYTNFFCSYTNILLFVWATVRRILKNISARLALSHRFIWLLIKIQKGPKQWHIFFTHFQNLQPGTHGFFKNELARIKFCYDCRISLLKLSSLQNVVRFLFDLLLNGI